MKKYLSMLCCLAVLFTAGCSDDKTEDKKPTGEAEITAFSFKAENNPGLLLKDCVGSISGLAIKKIDIKVPAGTDLSALTASFEVAGDESTVTVNGTIQNNGKSTNDFNDPVDYLVTQGNRSALYMVTVSELPEAVWTKVTELEQNATYFCMEIDPTDNKPGLAMQTPNASAPQGPMVYAKLNDDNVFVTQTAYDANTRYLSFGYGNSGQPYIYTIDYVATSSKRTGTIITHKNGSWSREDIATTPPSGYIGLSICELDGKVFAFSSNDKAGTNVPRRHVNMTSMINGVWTTDQTIPNRPAGNGYWPFACVKDGAMYVLVMNPVSPNSFSIYKYTDNIWTTVIEAYAYPSAAGDGTYQSFPLNGLGPNMAVDNDGNMYVAICYNYSPQVLKIDAATAEVTPFGSAIPPVGSTAGRYARIAISPVGAIYMAYLDSSDMRLIQVVSFNKKTKDWNNPIQLSSDKSDDFDFKFAKDGTAYIAYHVLEEKIDGVVTRPSKIHLYKLATAE